MRPRDQGVLVGTMALEEGARVDFTRLRKDRRERVFEGMEADNLDALILGRIGDVRYTSGARQLWRAGVNPFAAVCVAVRETGRVHLLSVWDEGIPPEIANEDLYPMFWNPGNLLQAVGAIPGLGQAERVGTDGLTPMFGQVLPALFPGGELVDGSPAMARARSSKTTDEITCITVAAAIAEAGLSALEQALVPGVTERELLGVYEECVARLGAPNPASESAAFATAARGPVRFRYLATDRPVGEGELVVLSPGALYAGYEASLARTRLSSGPAPRGAEALAERCWRGLDALVGACRAGNTGADLRRAWESTGERLPSVVLAHGLGLGVEPPVIGLGRGDGAVLQEDAVLCVQSWVTAEGTGGVLERAVVRVGADGPEVLTRVGRFAP